MTFEASEEFLHMTFDASEEFLRVTFDTPKMCKNKKLSGAGSREKKINPAKFLPMTFEASEEFLPMTFEASEEFLHVTFDAPKMRKNKKIMLMRRKVM